ncbi:hypothetical protein [Crossiella sp. NPDC003009]
MVPRKPPSRARGAEFIAATDRAKQYLNTATRTDLDALAVALLRLRATFTREDGEPDLTATTKACKLAIGEVLHAAGIAGKDHAAQAVQARIRRRVQVALRDELRAQAGGDEGRFAELCAVYRIAEQTPVQATNARVTRAVKEARAAEAAIQQANPAATLIARAEAVADNLSLLADQLDSHGKRAAGVTEEQLAALTTTLGRIAKTAQKARDIAENLSPATEMIE